MKYRNGAAVVEAVQWSGWCTDEVRDLCGDDVKFIDEYEAKMADGSHQAGWKHVMINGIFGETKADIGDYIVKDNSRLYVISPMTFLQFYRAA